MHSYTSSSDQRLPGGPGLRTWLGALAVLVTALGVWEGFWRAAGVRASARDPAAYIVVRSRVRPTSTVLLGTSKMQSDVDPRVWARATGGARPLNLAVAGSSPLPLLESLASDSTFRGTVVTEILPRTTFAAGGGRERAVSTLEAEYAAAAGSPAEWIEARLGLLVSSAFVFRRSGLRLDDALRSIRARRWPRVPDFRMRADRFLPLTFDSAGVRDRVTGDLRRFRDAEPPADGAEVDAIVGRIRRAAGAIESRGGSVVLVQFPGSGEVRAFEEERYPRARFWDPLVAGAGVRSIHSGDEPSLAAFFAPDGSHIAESDTRAFTEALAALVTRRAPP